MAVREPEFLLPPEFLTADDVLAGYPNTFEKTGLKTKPDLDLCFPAEFPYDLCSSPAASTGTESDEEEFLAELTRRLTRSSLDDTHKSTAPGQNHFESWLLSGSPQSTLARVGSWSGMSAGSSNGTRSPNGPSQISSPTTPLGAKSDAWDLILQAAGQVARLRMRAGDELPATRTFAPLPPVVNPHAAVHNVRLHKQVVAQMVKQQGCAMWDNGCYIEPQLSQTRPSRAVFGGAGPFVENGRYGRPVVGGGGHAAALRSQHFQHQTQSGRPGMPFGGSGGGGGGGGGTGGFGMKRERAGTGVFLPRRYGNNNTNKPVDSASKTGCCTTAKVVHGLHKNFQDLNGVFVSDYDMLIARRNAAMLAQQRRNFLPELAISHEVCLPQEWTY